MKKRILISLLLFTFLFCNAREGMWMMPLLEKQNAKEMQSMGMQISAADIYNPGKISLKDAVVQFGGGCTGEIISDHGLVLTNHHCGFNFIQALSTLEKNYLRDGYWASSFENELPCPGLTVTMVVDIKDVSSAINSALYSSMTEQERDRKIKQLSDSLEKKSVEGTGFKSFVRSFYNGNEFYLFITDVFKDVRYVGSPPLSIGRFGGETDNWMWPRHTADFSLFRIYAGKDNKTADYSKDNIPYHPKIFFTINTGGIKEGDFTMVMGFPGRTNEYLTSFAVDQICNQTNPDRIKIRDLKLNIIGKAMQSNDTIRLQYAPKYKTIANAYKKWKGEDAGLLRDSVILKKQKIEQAFNEWIQQDASRKNRYGNLLHDLQQNYAASRKLNYLNDYVAEALHGIELVSYSQKYFTLISLSTKDTVDTAAVNSEVKKLLKGTDDFYKNYNPTLDQRLCVALLQLFDDNVQDAKPGIYNRISSDFKHDFEKYSNDVFHRSMFVSKEKVIDFLKNYRTKDVKRLLRDEAVILSKSIRDFNEKEVIDSLSKYNRQIAALQRTYVKALREMQPEKFFYPDANSTLRLSYGTIAGYKPRDGVTYSYQSTLDGVIEKSNLNMDEYAVPAKLVELYRTKNYGRYGENGKMPTDFLATTHTTGGNSGSPMLNAKGELIGTNFDSVWEGTASDLYYEETYGRNISVDIRFILFIIEKFGEANRLIDEMKIIR